MQLEPIEAMDDGWWEQTVSGGAGRMWTIRVRIMAIDGDEFYECWINAMPLPARWRRDHDDEEAAIVRIIAIGRQSLNYT